MNGADLHSDVEMKQSKKEHLPLINESQWGAGEKVDADKHIRYPCLKCTKKLRKADRTKH
jgi:hypothetical protein